MGLQERSSSRPLVVAGRAGAMIADDLSAVPGRAAGDESTAASSPAQIGADRLAEGFQVAGEISRSSTIWNATHRVKPLLERYCTRGSREHPQLCAPRNCAVLRRMMSKCSSSVIAASPFLVSWYSPWSCAGVTSHSRRTMSSVSQAPAPSLCPAVIAEQHRDVVAPARVHREGGRAATPSRRCVSYCRVIMNNSTTAA